MKRGKFIVIYGVNNIGKTTQAKLLTKRIEEAGREVVHIKYPIYNMEPTRSMINEYLREGNPSKLSPREAQTLFAFNRTQFEPILRTNLAAGINVVAEDYVGTSLAWGLVTGVEKEYLLKVNSHLVDPDVVILLDGEQFSGREVEHQFEGNDELTRESRAIHLQLAKEFGWHKISANDSLEIVSANIVNVVSSVIDLSGTK